MDDRISIGVDTNCVPDIEETLQFSRSSGYDFISVPLVHPRYRRPFDDLIIKRDEPLTRSDILLPSSDWTTSIIGKISPWLDCDSESAAIRSRSEKALKQEVAWATHLGLHAVMLPSPRFQSTNYSHIINHVASNLSYMQAWVKIPLMAPEILLQDDDHQNSEQEARETDTWEWWNNLRLLAEHNSNMGVALELTADLPGEKALKRWLGEPVKAVILPTSIFLTNKLGYPTLSKKHQTFLCRLFRYRLQFIVSGSAHHKDGLAAYQQYVRFLYRKQSPLTEQEHFEAPYWDYLQAPLQPLMDNLESQTYETFERDPVKYREYERAVFEALKKTDKDKETVLMVVGAGRGPLVAGSLRAAKQANRKVRVYAVDKNPNAVITLRNRKVAEGWDNVTVVDTDMRVWNAPEKADILVSELLGSFGDNELSPECLDGAQKFLKEDGGISIPSAYTSFLAPLSSSKLYNEVKAYNDRKHFETAYVVKFHNIDQLADAKPCFTFTHPNRAALIDNTRYTKLSWVIEEASTLHGFGGFFDATLFDDVHVSINPATFSEGMISWFPLFFPLRTPVYVPKGATVEAHFWRHVTSTKVWYEWTITSPAISPVHNPQGRSYWIGLQT
jgi:protein arginine N-methyltransferase 5